MSLKITIDIEKELSELNTQDLLTLLQSQMTKNDFREALIERMELSIVKEKLLVDFIEILKN